MAGGPGLFRIFVQPTVAILLGVIHGLRDRRAGQPVYVVGLIRVPAHRWRRLGEGARSVAVPFAVALVAAYTFQYIVRGRIFVSYGLVYAILFVLLPYLTARGVAHRIARRSARLPPGTSVHVG
jgi:hypothetical protein